MTVEQLEKAKELESNIIRNEGRALDLDAVIDRLQAKTVSYDLTRLRIYIGYEYEETPLINFTDLIQFLEKQKSKYSEVVVNLKKEFSEL